jgi:hypothetical protein
VKIEAGLEECKKEAGQIKEQGEMKTIRQKIRHLVLLKFICDLATEIASLKQSP